MSESNESKEAQEKRRSSAYGIEIASNRVRSKRRKDGSREPRWESRLRSVGLGFLVYLFRRISNGIGALFGSLFLLSLPFSVLLLISSTDFLILTSANDSGNQLFFDAMGITYEDERRDEAELLKTQVLKYVYFFIMLFSLYHWRSIAEYFKAWPHWTLLLLCLIAGSAYSIDPTKVATNTILIVIGLCAAVLFCLANAQTGHNDNLYKAIFIPMLLINIVSVGIFFLYDVSFLEFLFSSNRYGGLAGNPNTLGAVVVLGYWAAISLIMSRTSSVRVRIAATASMPLFLLHVIMSGSGTALVAIVLVTIVMFWLRFLALFRPNTRVIINVCGAVLFVLVLLATLISSTPADIYISFTTSLGKDQSLTGRTELWDIAGEAIAQRPYFGWGFDSHASVKAVNEFDIEYNHYHNGFLDTLVAGGFLLLGLVIYNLGRFGRAYFLAFRRDASIFPLVLPLIILVFLNFSEFSLLRPNSAIWQIYVVAFVLLTFQQNDRLLSRFSKKKKPKQSRRNKRQLRWA